MKKVFCVNVFHVCLLLSFIFNTSYAVTFSSQYNGDGSFDILYQGQLPPGAALNITLPDGLTTDYTLCSVNSYYNFFPDWVSENTEELDLFLPVIESALGRGHSLAFIDSYNTMDSSASLFAVSMVAFDQSAFYMKNEYGDYLRPGALPTNPYDVNGDAQVNIIDVGCLIPEWLAEGDPEWGIELYFDFNGDNIVNLIDLAMIGHPWMASSSATSGILMTIQTLDYDPMAEYGQIGIELNELRGGIYEVPEPATVSLLILGGLALLKRRKNID